MNFLPPTRERFLLAIAQEVPAERIAEIHFLQPMKQGGVESGVAVVAADEGRSADVEVREDPELALQPSAIAARFTVYTARYRLVLKGPDRGKWDASVIAEADAPLITVDAVVRGVQRRSGDVDAPERMGGDEVRAIVPAPDPIPSPERP